MAPMIGNHSQTIIITPANMSSVPLSKIQTNEETASLPNYAVGLFETNGSGPRKRKRLTHLTPDEKIMRRKLKNRVAAQTARDRKKARMETLEETVAKIHEQTKKLLDVNLQLLQRTETLERENQILCKKLGIKGDSSFTEQKREELMTIKEEFESIITEDELNSCNNNYKCDSSDDEIDILKYCEPCEDNDNDIVSDDSRYDSSKCGSPVPAAFGERVQERLIPQQQEAVNSVKLIHLPDKHQLSMTQCSQLLETQSLPNNMRTISRTSSKNLANNWNLKSVQTKMEMPLDLSKQQILNPE